MKKLIYLITLLPLSIFLLMVIFLWRGLNNDPHQIPSPLINHPVPKFTAPDLLTQQLMNQNNLRGQITLLNVFASWCISCRVEHPILMDISRDHRVILMGLNYKDQMSQVMPWLKENGNPYQSIIQDSTGDIGINFGVYGTPETFIIDKAGVIRYKYLGPLTHDLWQNEILPVIKKMQK